MISSNILRTSGLPEGATEAAAARRWPGGPVVARHGGGDSAAVAWGHAAPAAAMAWRHAAPAAAAMVAARGNLDERKPLFEARNRILWLATVSRMPAPSSKISRSPKFSAQ